MPHRLVLSIALVLVSLTVGCGGGVSAADHYQKGLQAEQRGDWDTARKEFDAAKTYQDATKHSLQDQQNAATVATAYDRGSTALVSKQYQDAIAQFDTVLKLSPSYKDTSAKRTTAQQQLDSLVSDALKKAASGDLSGAATELKTAGTYQGSDKKAADLTAADTAYGTATKAISQEKWWDAYTQLSIVVKLAPDFKDAQAQLQTAQQKLDGFVSDADAKAQAGDLKAAITAYQAAGGYKQSDQKATSLNSKITQLDQLYGRMEASAKAGNWADAFDAVASILADVPTYRDVKDKRASYLEQVYAAAGTAGGQGDWKLAIQLYSLLLQRSPNYKDVNEKLAAARVAVVPKPGTVLYQADWTNGPNGWLGTRDWKFTNGLLVNDGSVASSIILAPFQVETQDYAVEAEIQFLSDGDSRGVLLRSDGTACYAGGVDRYGTFISTCTGGNIVTQSYKPDKAYHLFRLEAKANNLTLYIDGVVALRVSDNRYLSGKLAGLYSGTVQLNVRSFKVIAL